MRSAACILLASTLLGIATPALARGPSIGSGWSRAPDLSVFGAMLRSSALAREQDILCAGRNPAAVEDAWRATYGAREQWIADAIARRYGPAALAPTTVPASLGRIACPTVADTRWRRHHARMLRLLEFRLVPRDHFRRPAP